ncbi:centromere protein U isoform X2 [Poecilia latipinna]|uniref:centromere protein U isoform X2 n=1 Tax=Poecilia latipinna TaxID=48699 RepID=UPI00072DFBBB|nr:PREDICTED: centromere protein U-like isoform X2 [Poecilia latipinna]
MVPSGTRTVLREAAVSGRANGVNKTLTKVRKGQGTKVPPGQAHKSQMESTSLSAVDQASFLEGLERNDSNPLHSTALEEHLDVQEEERLDKKRVQRGNIAPVEKQGAAAKRKGSGGGEEEERKKKSRTDTAGKGRARQQKGAAEKQPDEKVGRSKTTRTMAAISRRLSGKKPVGMRKVPGRTGAGRTAAGRPAQRQQLEEEGDTASESADEKTSESEEEFDSDGGRRKSRRLPSSDEEDDAGSVWNPTPMTTKRLTKRLSLGRKSSSNKTQNAKASGGIGQKKRAGRVGSQLEVVLDAVLDFCQQYGETVESAAVRESIDCFTNNVEAQLEEQISSLKDLRSLKRENIKVGSLIRTKTQRLLNAKHELMRAERQLWLLEKEKAELQQRLDDLRRGRTFLQDVRELTARYLAHRHKHPAEKETFGASSLPALLLETKLIQLPEHPPSEVQAKKTAQK